MSQARSQSDFLGRKRDCLWARQRNVSLNAPLRLSLPSRVDQPMTAATARANVAAPKAKANAEMKISTVRACLDKPLRSSLSCSCAICTAPCAPTSREAKLLPPPTSCGKVNNILPNDLRDHATSGLGYQSVAQSLLGSLCWGATGHSRTEQEP